MTATVNNLGILDKLVVNLKKLPIKPSEMAKTARVYAEQIAPEYTGATKKSLQVINYKDKSILRLHRPVGSLRDYHLWMHGLGGLDISNWIKSGDPKFMFTTFEWLQKEVNKQYKHKLDKLKKL